MFKNKIVTFGLAGALAMSSLAACGNQAATTDEAAKTETSTTDAAATEILYWEGTLADGQEVAYMEDDEGSNAILSIGNSDRSVVKTWTGKFVVDNDKVTITDDQGNNTITFTVLSAANDASFKINIEGYGEVELKPISADEFAKQVETEIANMTVYWEGTLADASTVNYVDGGEDGLSILSVTSANGNDAKAWTGKAAKQDDKVTITDETSKEAITFTVVSSSDSAMKLNIDGYGEVELKPVTTEQAAKNAGDALAKASDELAKTTLYWQGALTDGSTVVYMYDVEANEYTLGVIKADASDAKLWSGKGTVDDVKTTITDTESKQTVTFTVLKVADDLSSLSINIEGYGDVELKPVTAGEFADAAGQFLSSVA